MLKDIDPQGLISNTKTFVTCGAGDLQEGAASEAASLAGCHSFNNYIMIYDDNGITIEGKTDLAWREDVDKRYEAYGQIGRAHV